MKLDLDHLVRISDLHTPERKYITAQIARTIGNDGQAKAFYCTKGNVPVGIDIDNTIYWELFATVKDEELIVVESMRKVIDNAPGVHINDLKHDSNSRYSVGHIAFGAEDAGQGLGYMCVYEVPANQNIPITDKKYWTLIERKVETNYMVGCAAILFDPSGKVLVGERVDYAGVSIEALFGGKPEFYESLAEGLSREIAEEVNVHVDPKRFTQIAMIEASPGRGLKCVTAYFCAMLDWEEVQRVKNLEPHKCFGLHWRTVDEVSNRGLWQDASQYVRRAFGALFTMRRSEDYIRRHNDSTTN